MQHLRDRSFIHARVNVAAGALILRIDGVLTLLLVEDLVLSGASLLGTVFGDNRYGSLGAPMGVVWHWITRSWLITWSIRGTKGIGTDFGS